MSRPNTKGRPYQRHGLNALQTALASVAERSGAVPFASLGEAGEALRAWRADIIADLGGEESISAQERAVVDAAATTFLMLSSVDRFLLEQPSLVNRSRRELFPVVLQRQRLADALVRYLETLGLRRRTKDAPDLGRYLSERYGSDPEVTT
jgi:hypothetical protein